MSFVQSDSHEVFHAGERAVQTRVGVRARMAELGPRVIRDYMPDQHREFFSRLPFLIAGSVDASGQPWASILTAAPGFIQSPDARHLTVRAQPPAFDPLRASLRELAPVGLLGIQPHTRRRNRMNGVIERVNPESFSLRVVQSFGNCPKYIQAREMLFVAESTDAEPVPSDRLDPFAKSMIERADTFFIATAAPAGEAVNDGGVDVSHRGGAPGFVRIEGDTLLAPDYAGNFFFNTLGNLQLEPRAGLLFIDFDRGDLLYLAVAVDVVWEGAELQRFTGAQRLLRMRVLEQLRVPAGLPLRWSEPELSPYLP
jgi:predicted pyridoxine 5'-phosphate oxidase superfamily flavin-nucleotide-binding protein